MDESPICLLPLKTLQQIFSTLPLPQIMICRYVSKFFHQILISPSHPASSTSSLATHPQPPRYPPTHHRYQHPNHCHASILSSLDVFDPELNQWLKFSLDFLPFRSPFPVASSLGLVYIWGHSPDSFESNKSLVVCHPLTRELRVLPQLGSAWSLHGSVLVNSANRVMVLTDLAALYLSAASKNQWVKFSSNLPSKPRSPILVSDSVYALCDVGSPWRSQWKLFSCNLTKLTN